jgi:hypothetical protein
MSVAASENSYSAADKLKQTMGAFKNNKLSKADTSRSLLQPSTSAVTLSPVVEAKEKSGK